MRIYILEQNQNRAKLMQDVLGIYNYNIVTVNKSHEFFKKAYSQKPTVIIMNEKFADNSGSRLLEDLRKDPVTSNVPVIYIKNDTPVSELFASGSLDRLTEFVSEPLKIKNLRHYIDRWTTFKSLYVQH